MSDLGADLARLAGTPQGLWVAAALALMSAVSHAMFGALQKGRHDPWATRAAIDGWLVLLSAPMAIFLVTWPDGHLWLLMAGVVVIHFSYKLVMALAYRQAPYTVVYPIVRGTGPLVTVAAAAVLFGEHFSAAQWGGVALLSGALMGLAWVNLRVLPVGAEALRRGLGFALLGGFLVALYTTYDAWAIRATPDPFTFLAWFFLLSSLDFPIISLRRWSGTGFALDRGLVLRGLAGALLAFASFGGVMLATRIGTVGQAAVLRETSTLFAALIGWVMLGERTVGIKLLLMGLIALGAVIVQTAG